MYRGKELREKVQEFLSENRIGAWVIWDFNRRNPASYVALGEDLWHSRPAYTIYPVNGEPVAVVSSVEVKEEYPNVGKVVAYGPGEEKRALASVLESFLSNGNRTIAMETSELPQNDVVPYQTVLKFLADSKIGVVSSDQLLVDLTRWDKGMIDLHQDAADKLCVIKDGVFEYISDRVRHSDPVTEWKAKNFILDFYSSKDMVTDMGFGPVVAVGAHSADPHYDPKEGSSAKIERGKIVLVDIWAKRPEFGAPYADITFMGYTGNDVPEEASKRFRVLRGARDAGVAFVEAQSKSGTLPKGYEVDGEVRRHLVGAGYGSEIKHRTGHDLGLTVADPHGNRVNMDNLEFKDERRLTPGSGFTIEPGLYVDGLFGLRTEINVIVRPDGTVYVSTEKQDRITPLL
jgi:Xaa-Pro aminopeptidase